jgi:hypothetical protein
VERLRSTHIDAEAQAPGGLRDRRRVQRLNPSAISRRPSRSVLWAGVNRYWFNVPALLPERRLR